MRCVVAQWWSPLRQELRGESVGSVYGLLDQPLPGDEPDELLPYLLPLLAPMGSISLVMRALKLLATAQILLVCLRCRQRSLLCEEGNTIAGAHQANAAEQRTNAGAAS